ncbi:hypothetical protein [Sphingomonas sanxanigenens]|uniref:HTTM domain-containing protein n=1 Tax=Sphingomonas sanxanigenens DSM 19645 = NX02 TaxID=1123269 RepID=W0A8C2_9SPHN|nr:hypothetical protein [Sphingomonas sanxanigenens]AHE53351.1 hypothetical protein NX02_08135 [Sphingomonas sanxanigenens DSM 19645 = NX02]
MAAGEERRLSEILIHLLAALLLFTLLRQGTDFVADASPGHIWLWAGIVAAPALGFGWVGYRALPAFAVRAMRGAACFLTLYFLAEPFAIPYAALGPEHPASLFHAHARWVGAALALVGFWRPSAIFAAAMILWMMRELQTGITGFYFSTLDIRNVAEVIAFWAIGFVVIGSARAIPRVRAALGVDEAVLGRAALTIFAAGVGAHLANYFWSGLAKLTLDGGPLSWPLGNRLADGVPAALEKGTMPFAAWPGAVQLIHDVLVWTAIPVNLLALGVQLIAIAAPLRRRWLLLATLSFDLFHIIVWASLGLLFWKWIALNLIIVAALTRVDERDWTALPRWTCIAFVIAGMAMFRTATLAWYETPGFATPHFEAVMDDGTRHRIPNAYFNSSSYQVSQGRLWWPGGKDHFNPSIWGSVLHWDDALAGRNCRVPERAAPAAPEWGPTDALARFVQAHHRQMLPRLDAAGRSNYYLVPHHHVPSAFVADRFSALDKRRIATYIYVMDSVCLGLDHGRLTRRVVAHTELPLYDAKHDRVLP